MAGGRVELLLLDLLMETAKLLAPLLGQSAPANHLCLGILQHLDAKCLTRTWLWPGLSLSLGFDITGLVLLLCFRQRCIGNALGVLGAVSSEGRCRERSLGTGLASGLCQLPPICCITHSLPELVLQLFICILQAKAAFLEVIVVLAKSSVGTDKAAESAGAFAVVTQLVFHVLEDCPSALVLDHPPLL